MNIDVKIFLSSDEGQKLLKKTEQDMTHVVSHMGKQPKKNSFELTPTTGAGLQLIILKQMMHSENPEMVMEGNILENINKVGAKMVTYN